MGNLLTQTDVRGNVTTYTYDKNYNVKTITSPTGAVTTYTYDALNRNTAIEDSEGNVTSFAYNALSLQTSMTDAKGNVTAYEYDKNGNRTKLTYPDGSYAQTKYDERGRTIWQKDTAGRETEYTYDSSDRLIEVKQNHGAITKYAYDQTGNLISITDANENTTTYVYDENGRRVKVILADGAESTSEYDTHGILTSSTDCNGVTTTYSYDEEDRLVKETTGAKATETETTTYTYDSLGRLTDVATKDSHVSYTYNKYGELSAKTYENGQKVVYTYDGYGRQQETRVTQNGTQLSSTKYEYDTMNRLTRVVGHDGTAVVYTYDVNGNRETATFANGQVITYTYDECNRLTLQKVVDRNGTVIAQYQYTLGKGGERTQVTESGACGNVETAYSYDNAGRLIKETIQKGEETTTYKYDYDDVGNRIEKRENGVFTTYTYNSRNQLVTEETEVGVVTYSYDANGNLLSQSGAGKAVAYTYDVYNRFIQYTEGSVKETYTYDAEGVRRSKVNGDDTIYYISDTTGSLSYTLAETDKDGNVIATYNRADVLISQVRGEETSYYLFDGHGDVRALNNIAGRITDKYRYNAYGELIEQSGETENHYLYTGEYYDGTSNLYYLRARYMNPSTGTFISMDTYEGSIYDPDTLHKYLYANGNPVKYSDPSGHMFGAVLAINASEQVERSKIDNITFNIGMTMLRKARAVVDIQNVMAIAVSYKITKVLYDYFMDAELNRIYDLDIVVTEAVAKIAWPWEKEEEKVVALEATKEEEQSQVYYHATSIEGAARIMLTGCLIGSVWEGGYVFAWRQPPNGKALKLSGAHNREVIVCFETQVPFVDDVGIVNPYVKKFGPVRSYFSGPIKISNIMIMPVLK